MAKYTVYIKAIESATITVDAEDEDLAIDKANIMLNEGKVKLEPEDTEITIA